MPFEEFPPSPLTDIELENLGYNLRALQRGGVTSIGWLPPTRVRPGDLISGAGYDPRTHEMWFAVVRPQISHSGNGK